MEQPREPPEQSAPRARELVRTCALAAIAGSLVGFVGGAFRWCLQVADTMRHHVLAVADDLPGPGWFVPLAFTALGAALAALIVRPVPLAAGSGIQHVEAVQRGEAAPPSIAVVPARFVGGILGIGSGLVLGREGPIVHMGATIGAETARRAHADDTHVRELHTAVSGAGLAVAFNAPIGGALFVFEEITRTVRFRTAVPVLVSVATGVGCARLILGDRPDFTVPTVAPPSLALLPVFVTFGVLTGVLGAGYNRAVTGALVAADAVRSLPPVAKAATIGAAVGLLSAFAPLSTGGGDAVAQHLIGGGTLALPAVAGYVLLRFATGPLSYAAGTPGGLFAPLLALGSLWGVLCAGAAAALVPGVDASITVPMALVGMAALFGATVRAPLTGIVLVVEMTATTGVTVPMLAATAAAMVVAHLCGAPPIYDSLRKRMLARPPE
ncbi:MAG: ClC family H(+)/Cl(-) exchange transporter [Rhodococcus sp.]|uniref:ClC family H(+)/Cl(-) exchange transporter n=1 Tax=Rhodococcus TaxID=1827 RepID=UPI00169045A7|nr:MULTISPECIES: ClC family H(+)/Cl(-) exchange transporter [Rhodococcus]NLV81222.1 ClC family H(+)/Cl(-) exchange transporter [Rhodococcus sp. (in: high G+C Gram-positive bacteria)]